MNETERVRRLLASGCRIDDLQVNGMGVLQHPERYRFTTDPVLLASFCRVKPSTRIADLGSGCGILGLLLVGKYGAASCHGIEIQPQLSECAEASAELNGLSDRVTFSCGAVQDFSRSYDGRRFDLVVSNPPYTRTDGGARNESEEIALARHEVKLTLDELICAADRLVKFGGRFCLVHQAERFGELCAVCDRYGFAPKRARLVEGREGLAPTLVLLEALKGGKVGMKWERNLTLYRRDGTETEELSRIYGRETR